MKRNLDLTRGLVFSGQLLLDLSAAGMLREEAYKLVQGHAMAAWEEDGDFRVGHRIRSRHCQTSERRERWRIPSLFPDSYGTSTRSSSGCFPN